MADYTGLQGRSICRTAQPPLQRRRPLPRRQEHLPAPRRRRKPACPNSADLNGQTAIVIGDKDVAAAAKVLKTFTAEFKKPEVKTGIVDKLVVSTEQIQPIADLPSREVLLATLLGLLNAPGDQLVRVLNEPASALARVLKAKADEGRRRAPKQPLPQPKPLPRRSRRRGSRPPPKLLQPPKLPRPKTPAA